MDDLEERITEIIKFMEYSVPAAQLDEALDLLEVYRNDEVGLALLHEFYSNLPTSEECSIREIRVIGRNHGIFLLTATTHEESFIYLISEEGIEFQGKLADGLWDQEIIDFFGLEEPHKLLGDNTRLEDYPLYDPLNTDIDTCPSCRAATGEYHELGCPVEVCPWCGGQFIHCGCRFDLLELDFIGEEDLPRLEELLEERGRIPYAPEQRPAFPSVSEG